MNETLTEFLDGVTLIDGIKPRRFTMRWRRSEAIYTICAHIYYGTLIGNHL